MGVKYTPIGCFLPDIHYLAKQNNFTDNSKVNPSYFSQCSGNWNNGTNAGTFYLNLNNSTSNSNSNIGAHLKFSYAQLFFSQFYFVIAPIRC